MYVRIPRSIQCLPLDIQACIGTRLLYLKPLHPAPKILWLLSAADEHTEEHVKYVQPNLVDAQPVESDSHIHTH